MRPSGVERDLNSGLNFERARIPERTTRVEVVVVGGGIAGLSCAKALGKSGIETLVVERQQFPPLKSLFVQGEVLWRHGLLEPLLTADGALFPVNGLYIESADTGQVISRPAFVATQPERNYYAIEYPPLIECLRQEIQSLPSVSLLTGETVVQVKEFSDEVRLRFANKERIRASYLIDASGEAFFSHHGFEGKESKNLVDGDPMGLWIYGFRVFGDFDQNTLLNPIGEQIGRGSWVLPYSEIKADVIAADYCCFGERDLEKQKAKYENLKRYVSGRQMCFIKSEEEKITGFIRLEPISPVRARKTKRIFPLGAAAGMGSPLMGEVIPTCLEWGAPLSEILKKNGTPWEFYRTWRFLTPSFPYEKEMAMLRLRLKNPLAGTNFPVYRAILRWLPEEAQREVLLRRRVPWPYSCLFFFAALTSPDFVRYLPKFFKEYLQIKRENNVAN